jgi:hypothetical protein
MEPLLWQILANIKDINDETLPQLLISIWADRTELTCHSFMNGFVADKCGKFHFNYVYFIMCGR